MEMEEKTETEWILVDDLTGIDDPQLKRVNAGTYQVYWYAGEEMPEEEADIQYAGEVVIEKADAVVIAAPVASVQ